MPGLKPTTLIMGLTGVDIPAQILQTGAMWFYFETILFNVPCPFTTRKVSFQTRGAGIQPSRLVDRLRTKLTDLALTDGPFKRTSFSLQVHAVRPVPCASPPGCKAMVGQESRGGTLFVFKSRSSKTIKNHRFNSL